MGQPKTQKSNTLLYVLLGVILVLVICVACLGGVLIVKPLAPAPEPEPTESGAMVPTSAPPGMPGQPEPTQGPTPTLLPGDPEQELGKPDGQDNFDNTNNWTLFDVSCFKSEIVDGQYVMTAKGSKGFACWEVSWPKVHDYYLQSTVKMPDSCNGDDRFGLFVRTPDLKQGYLVGMNCNGQVGMTAWDGESTTTLIKYQENGAIQNGPGAENRLGVYVYGSTYRVYVNGQLVGEATDTAYVGDYRFGYFIRAATDEPFAVRYDNMRIWLLDK